LVLTQGKIDRARKILGAATEMETIERALDTVADLEAFRRDKSNRTRLERQGFFNDILIALTARDIGATVATHNSREFALIASAIGTRFTEDLPERT